MAMGHFKFDKEFFKFDKEHFDITKMGSGLLSR